MRTAESKVYDMDVDVPCPRCGYLVWVRLVEVVARTAVLCPVCRTRLRLVDEDASVQGAAQEIDQVIDSAVSKMNKTLRRISR